MEKILNKLYDYQIEILNITDKEDKGIVCLPTGSGKTYTQAAIIAKDIILNKNKFGVYVINAPRILLSYQLLKEVYTFLVYVGLESRYMSVHSGGIVDLDDLEQIRIDANFNEGTNIKFSEIQNGTSPKLIKEFSEVSKSQNIPLIIFSTYNSAVRINDAIPETKLRIVVNDEAQYLVQEQFYDIIRILKSRRQYFFTATIINTPSNSGRGMNNVQSYGEVIYKMLPREAIDRGKMIRPRLHFVIPPVGSTYTRSDFENSLGKIISESLAQHQYAIGQFSSPKLLVSVKGVGDIKKFFSSKEYSGLIRGGYKIYAVASDESIGNNINGKKVSRREFLNMLKEDGKNLGQKLLILHYDILAEGLDISGITGIMPLRILGKSKFLQTYGRAARPDLDDRKRMVDGEIKPNDLSEFNKPYAWVIVPTIVHEDSDAQEHIKELISELRDYGFDPSEDIISTNSKNGLPTIEGVEALNEIKRRCSNIGKTIEYVEAEYEDERIAKLTEEEWLLYNFPDLLDNI